MPFAPLKFRISASIQVMLQFGFALAQGAIFAGALAACQKQESGSLIAVATNFRASFEALEADFERRSPHRITGVYGGTGQLYTQIMGGANYQAFLAADQQRPERLEANGRGIAGSRFVYAQGRLALWTREDSPLANQFTPQHGMEEILSTAKIERLAIANPKLAPYGAAAVETAESLGARARLAPHFVQGENAGQAFALVATGNAQAGLIALADARRANGGVYWQVPDHLHSPIAQGAILLGEHPSARAFLNYLRTPPAHDIMAAHGYTQLASQMAKKETP